VNLPFFGYTRLACQNYIGGVSSVKFRDYCLALFAMIPGTVLFVFLGASAGSLAESATSGSDPTVTIVVVVVGAFLGIVTIWLTTRYARKELNRILEERSLLQSSASSGAGDASDVESPDSEGQPAEEQQTTEIAILTSADSEDDEKSTTTARQLEIEVPSGDAAATAHDEGNGKAWRGVFRNRPSSSS